MCSRGVFQLNKLSIYFCDFGGSSSGVRQLISSPNFRKFLTENPHIKLQAICKRNHHPFVRGSYINGYIKQIPLRSLNQQESLNALNTLRNQLGRKSFAVSSSRVFCSKKSIQGKWQPNLFNTYPIAELTRPHRIPDVPTQSVEVEDPQKQVRSKDISTAQMKVRPFVDVHRSIQ